MKIVKQAALFCLGGGAYVGLELLYRGYSHASMFAAGGVCFLLIGRLGRFPLSWFQRGLWGVGIITSVELLTGLAVNRDYSVWDYRGQPGNFMGQICPLFMLLWVPIALLAVPLYRWAEAGLDRLLAKGS